MQYEEKKIALIVNELVSILMAKGSKELDIKIRRKDDSTEVTLIDNDCCVSKKLFEDLKQTLKAQRQVELEGYYWQLLGDNEDEDELHLVGAMLDTAEVYMVNKSLHIHVTRKS